MPDKKRQDNGASRRDFLGLLGVALGGVTLAGCGSGNGTAPLLPGQAGALLDASPFRGAVVPNGWQFESLLPIGKAADLGGINGLTPVVGVNAQGQIFLYAIKPDGFGIFELDTTTRNARRSVTGIRPIVQTSEKLPDGKTVGRLGNFDFNDAGTVAYITQPDTVANPGSATREQDADGVYIERNGAASTPLLMTDQALPGTNRSVGGVFGDVDISNNDNILVTGLVENADSNSSSDSLIYLPGASNPQVVASQGDAIPGSTQTVNNIGLVDAGMDGTGYTLQLESDDGSVTNGSAQTRDVSQSRSRLILVNNLGSPFSDAQVVHATGNFRSTRGVGVASGSFSFGARMGSSVGGKAQAAIVETSPGIQTIQVSGSLIGNASSPTMTGSRSPRGNSIITIGAPVIGDNLLFYTVMTDAGMEIIATNLSTYKTIIAYGDAIGGQTIGNLELGWHPDQVNMRGTIIVYAEMTDGTETILEGTPS